MAKTAAASQDFTLRLKFAITAARAAAALGRLREAENKLKAVLLDATRHGYLGYQFDARLALGEIELNSGQTRGWLGRVESMPTWYSNWRKLYQVGQLGFGRAKLLPVKVTAESSPLTTGSGSSLACSRGTIHIQLSKKYGQTELLRQVKGVGPITALAYVLTLENQFTKAKVCGVVHSNHTQVGRYRDSASSARIEATDNSQLRP